MNNTALAVRTDTMDDLAVIREQAALLLKSGFLPQAIKTPEQALAIIITGRELGIGAMAALNNISVIQGKPTVSPQLMLALINRSGQAEDIKIEATKEGATCTIKRIGRAPYTARFGPAEAAAMGLNGKDNYKKQPATMYKWRAVADACRVTCPDIILGLYLHEEMGAQVEPESGELVEAQSEDAQTARMPEPTPRTVYDETGAEPYDEPEPVRNVKLEGAQPKPETREIGPKTQQIINWMEKMGWEAVDLAAYIACEFKVQVDGADPVKAINALPAMQKKALHQMIKAELEIRNRTR